MLESTCILKKSLNITHRFMKLNKTTEILKFHCNYFREIYLDKNGWHGNGFWDQYKIFCLKPQNFIFSVIWTIFSTNLFALWRWKISHYFYACLLKRALWDTTDSFWESGSNNFNVILHKKDWSEVNHWWIEVACIVHITY